MSSYIVIDLEMCTVPEGEKQELYPWKRELIQIGAVRLNDSLEVCDSFMTYVCPEFGAVDNFIEDLTGISRDETKGAPTASEALQMFNNWLPDDTVLVTWSDSDEEQLSKEMELKGISIPRFENILKEYVDCQSTFSEKMDASKNYKLSEALNICGIYSVEGEHDALIDAKNTALLFAKMQREPKLVLSPYFVREDEVKASSHNPFAELLKDFNFDE